MGILYPSTSPAVSAGLVLGYNGNIIPAFFHSCCGGHTENSEHVWQQPFAYLQGRSSEYCRGTRHYQWELMLEQGRMRGLLGFEADIKEIRNPVHFPSGRVKELEFVPYRGKSRTLSGAELRRMLGANAMKSTLFTASVLSEGIFITGQGWGHGVGMCQWCAHAMAVRGMRADAILQHFYRGTEIFRKRMEVLWP